MHIPSARHSNRTRNKDIIPNALHAFRHACMHAFQHNGMHSGLYACAHTHLRLDRYTVVPRLAASWSRSLPGRTKWVTSAMCTPTS